MNPKYQPNPDVETTRKLRDGLLVELRRLREKLEQEPSPRTYTAMLETEAKYEAAQAKFLATEEAEEVCHAAFKKQRSAEEEAFLLGGAHAQLEFERRIAARRLEREQAAARQLALEAEKVAEKAREAADREVQRRLRALELEEKLEARRKQA